jgi:hypothetical protein
MPPATALLLHGFSKIDVFPEKLAAPACTSTGNLPVS